MRILIISVGKLRQNAFRELTDDYVRRIRRYATCDIITVKDSDPCGVRRAIEKATPTDAKRVALEVQGKSWSSHDLAAFFKKCGVESSPVIAFYIGGAYGLPPETSKSADVQLSLSRMTFPHQLAQVVLAEQIYRSFSILRNEPYSH